MDFKVDDLVERKLLVWCLTYVHDMCTDDDSTLEWLLEGLGCSELELFNGFETLRLVMGFKMKQKIDGVWVDTE